MIGETVFLGGCPVIRPEGIYVEGHRVVSLGGFGGLGALERHNPLPIGKYWVDVFEQDSANFYDWLAANKGAVQVTSTESFPSNGGGPAREWYLFKVSAPVSWNGPGFPTIAEPNVQSSSDTSQRPDPEKDPLDKLDDWMGRKGNGLNYALALGAVATVIVIGGVILYYAPRREQPPPPAPMPSPTY